MSSKLAVASTNLAAKGYMLVMLSLTINRALFSSSAVCHEELRRKRAVASCVRRWAKSRNLAVHFISKLELQEAGWPHWHVLIAVPRDTWFKMPSAVSQAGEFDGFWRYGFSNVQVNVRDVGYACKMAAYACKEAGGREAGLETLTASGLPGGGFHWIMPSHGFWAFCGVDPFDTRYAGQFGDDAVQDIDGEVAGARRERRTWASHADRVRECGWASVLVVEGGMRDDREGGHGDTFSVRLSMTRGTLGGALEEWFGYEGCEHFHDRDGVVPPPGFGVVEVVPAAAPRDVLGFLAWLPPDVFPLGHRDTLDWVAHRLGWASFDCAVQSGPRPMGGVEA